MRTRYFCVGILVGLLASNSPTAAFAQEMQPQFPAVNPDDIKHGAVLCSWFIFLSIKEVGEKCYPGQDLEFQAALVQSIDRIDQFIIDNTPTTREILEKTKKARLKAMPLPPLESLCHGHDGLAAFYELVRKSGPEQLRRGVDDLLSVPRVPQMNPCL